MSTDTFDIYHDGPLHGSLTGHWPPTDLSRLRALSSALVHVYGEEPTPGSLAALGELLRLDHPVARAIVLWHYSVANSHAVWGFSAWILDAVTSSHLRRIVLALREDAEWEWSRDMTRTGTILWLYHRDCFASGEPRRKPAWKRDIEAWMDGMSADPQAAPGHRLNALTTLPDSEARRGLLVGLVQGTTGEVAWEACSHLLTLEPARYEPLASSLLEREDRDWSSYSYQQLRTAHDAAARACLALSPASAFVITRAEHAKPDVGDVWVGDISTEGIEAIRQMHDRAWQHAERGSHAHDADTERMAGLDHPLARALALFYEQHSALSPCCRSSQSHNEAMRSLARRVLDDAPLTLLPAVQANRPREVVGEDSHRMAVTLLGRLGEPADARRLVARLAAMGPTALDALDDLLTHHPDALASPELRAEVERFTRTSDKPSLADQAWSLLARSEP